MPIALNQGVRTAKYADIVVLDSDCILDTNTLCEYKNALTQYAFVRGHANVIAHPGCWYKQTKLGVEETNSLMQLNPKLYGPAIAFKRDIFLQLGGYDCDILYGCDHEFSERVEAAGYKIGYCDSAIIWHKPISFFVDKSSHLGYGQGNYIKDKKNNTLRGFRYIMSKASIFVLKEKYKKRGFVGVVRSFFQCVWMLFGYVQGIKSKYQRG